MDWMSLMTFLSTCFKDSLALVSRLSPKQKIKPLIRACRRRAGRRKVVLKETQLTCMWNNIKGESPQDFDNYPSDMLLYYSYTNIQQTDCRSYFIETGRADFSVLSSTLDG
ncbi:mesothelin-like protein [Salvelinus sp. IW2-2015]|uniref:mesothelin-like protein n=1 Tax=Salvelinus sp. IW2-2015 TaxID=2691554 RepID=UPI0038D4FCD9